MQGRMETGQVRDSKREIGWLTERETGRAMGTEGKKRKRECNCTQHIVDNGFWKSDHYLKVLMILFFWILKELKIK